MCVLYVRGVGSSVDVCASRSVSCVCLFECVSFDFGTLDASFIKCRRTELDGSEQASRSTVSFLIGGLDLAS